MCGRLVLFAALSFRMMELLDAMRLSIEVWLLIVIIVINIMVMQGCVPFECELFTRPFLFIVSALVVFLQRCMSVIFVLGIPAFFFIITEFSIVTTKAAFKLSFVTHLSATL